MTNNVVRAAAEGMPSINRRAAMLGAGATMAALAASTRPAPAAASPLLDLIANHRRAHSLFHEAIGAEEDAGRAYRETNPQREILVPLSIGGGVSLYISAHWNDRDDLAECRKRIDRAYAESEAALRSPVGKLGIASPDEVTRHLRKAKAADLRTMRRLWKEEEARQEAFGLLPAVRIRDAASEAERDAAAALLAYRCLTSDEILIRADYITSDPRGSGGTIMSGLECGDERLLHALLFASLEEEGG